MSVLFQLLLRLMFAVRPALRALLGAWGRRLAARIVGVGTNVRVAEFGTTAPWDSRKPLVSVIIPCYNHGPHLPRNFASLAAQSLQDYEMILVDDGSTDPATVEYIDGLDLSRVSVIRQANAGPASARNAGIEQARGRYICCLDADDYVAPTYLEKCLLLLEGNTGIRLAYSWVRLVGKEQRLHRVADFDPGLLRYFNPICSAAVFHRADWQAVGGFDEARETMYEDWDFWISLARIGVRGKVIEEALLFYHQQPGSRLREGNRRGAQSYARMRARHLEFYRRTIVRMLSQGYVEKWTRTPLANLSRAEQYAPVAPCAVLAVITYCSEWTEWRRWLSTVDASDAFFVIVCECASIPAWLLARADETYWLESLLHPTQWPDFIETFKRTRRISRVLPNPMVVTGGGE
ncbi:glycosyltransferase family 2 protein [Metapseudomonas resinovorans]|uniref:glycosyltransferase family 2 protein n=1 Tax=Metapseudomonas resinovorans TaxID=53412 RepID=UPI0003F8AD5E|nr:glycosyltransferase family A protein [Pseudomonas resinovorans]